MSGAGTIDPRERFLQAIAERIGAERIAAIHLFPALRSGGRESAVAVVAAEADPAYSQGELPPPVGADVTETEGAATAADESSAGSDGEAQPAAGDGGVSSGDDAGGAPPDSHDTASVPDTPHPFDAPHTDSSPDRAPRLVVYRAVYRWTRKGPDRGKWEVDITAEADAPLNAISDVVRGVQRRAGEDGEPELITPEALRVALSDRPWAAAM